MLTLYDFGNSVCCQKVRITMRAKGLAWESVEVDLFKAEQYDPKYLKLNPKGIVPTLVHDGKPIIESTLICDYLDDVFPKPPLKPNSPLAHARMRLWPKLVDEGLHVACGTISFAAIFARQLRDGLSKEALEARLAQMPDPARRERQRQLIELGLAAPFVKDAAKLHDKAIGEMDVALGDGRPWLMGEQFTLADVVMAPYVERLDRLTLAGFWQGRPRVGDWLRRLKARPSFVRAFDSFQPHDYNDLLRDQGQDLWPQVRDLLAA